MPSKKRKRASSPTARPPASAERGAPKQPKKPKKVKQVDAKKKEKKEKKQAGAKAAAPKAKKKKKKATKKKKKKKKQVQMKTDAPSSAHAADSADDDGSRPVILFVAGAMGRMTGEDYATGVVSKPRTAQRAMLSRHGLVVGPVRSVTGTRLTGGAGAGMSRLVAIKSALADVRRAHPHRKVFLATQSAGGRMVAHAFAGLWQTKPAKDGKCARFPLGVVPEKGGAASAGIIKSVKALCADYPECCRPEGSIPTGVAGVMLFGYPLAHATQDRSLIFPAIKASAPPMLFVSGDNDDMGRGLESAVAKCQAGVHTKLVRVPGAGHEVWQPFNAQRHELVHAAVASFIEECSAA
jgi:hypothetical protein